MKIVTDPLLTASRIDTPVPYPAARRVFDGTLAVLLLIILSPFITLIFVAAKIEALLDPSARGPFLYSEERMSQGHPFRFYKIRIYKRAVLQDVLGKEGFIHTKPLEDNVNNLTRVGRLLKRFYLDELTQLANIVRGEMSFVGTRPWNRVSYEDEIHEGIFRKKVIKAGLTGLVQVMKGNHSQYSAGDRGLDDYYIHFCRTHPSWQILLFDVKILLLSIVKLLKGEGL